MKSRLLLIAILWLDLSAASVGTQQVKIAFPARQTTVGEVMQTIRSQTDYVFVFENTSFDLTRAVLLPGATLSLTEAVDAITAGNDHGYMIKKHFIVINSSQRQTPAAQPAAKARTGDRYAGLRDPDEVAGAWTQRPAALPAAVADTSAAAAEPEIAPAAVVTEPDQLPAFYSSYRNPDLYARIRHKLPLLAVKTNLLYGAAALTPNLSGEIGLGKRTSIEFGGSWNRFHRIGTQQDNRKLNHWIVRPEFRWWFCERFNGHFLGVHAFYSQYNISQYNVPLLFDKKYRYEGYAAGGGITYGYHWAFAKRWGLEFHLGVGVAHLRYDRFDCTLCSERLNRSAKTYVGPTRAGINLVFMIK